MRELSANVLKSKLNAVCVKGSTLYLLSNLEVLDLAGKILTSFLAGGCTIFTLGILSPTKNPHRKRKPVERVRWDNKGLSPMENSDYLMAFPKCNGPKPESHLHMNWLPFKQPFKLWTKARYGNGRVEWANGWNGDEPWRISFKGERLSQMWVFI